MSDAPTPLVDIYDDDLGYPPSYKDLLKRARWLERKMNEAKRELAAVTNRTCAISTVSVSDYKALDKALVERLRGCEINDKYYYQLMSKAALAIERLSKDVEERDEVLREIVRLDSEPDDWQGAAWRCSWDDLINRIDALIGKEKG